MPVPASSAASKLRLSEINVIWSGRLPITEISVFTFLTTIRYMSTQCLFVRVVSHNFLVFVCLAPTVSKRLFFGCFLSAVKINPRYACYQLVCHNMLSISRSANYHPRSLASPTQKVQVDLRYRVFVRPKKNNKIIQGHCTCLQHTASGS